ncbi:4-alpha-glucanotransferase [Ponticoccus sp. (in: a-proteobacteria)]|uniref:4-alpha-glucanotransferase n=1 Tax=Ponticoccus sp. (in: a-proteobacteria) TaxID=1925025 RepID=UPI003AB46DA2
MTGGDAALRALAQEYGVHAGFYDLQGKRKDASPPTLRALLGAMGVDAGTDAAVVAALKETQARAAAALPAEVIARAGVPLSVPLAAPSEFSLTDEAGTEVARGRADDTIDLPGLEMGYYTLQAGGAACFILCRPAHAPLTTEVADGPGWGYCGALYGLRSEDNGGLGSYRDLGRGVTALARTGADFLGLNPVHALGWATEEITSPYSPTHRGFFSTDHIAVAAGLGPTPEAPLVDYAAFRKRHRAALQDEFRAFMASDGDAGFDRYRAGADRALVDFAKFEAISAEHGDDFRQWPQALRTPGAEATQAAGDTSFHQWLQWRAEVQLDAAQGAAKAAGMDYGLYLDLAVGSRPGGAEVWMNAETIAKGVTIGAPPDMLNPEGQSWDLAAHAPARLKAARYAPLRAMLRKLMRHAGILRIDHVLGLTRSFWQPDDGSPGGYVSQPLEAFLAVIAIEARRAGCVVVGEDLGLVPEGFRERLNEAGLYSYAVWQYETFDDGTLRPVDRLRDFSLACFGTHDTPTITGFWYGQDIAWWRRMGWISEAEAQARHDIRARQRHVLRAMCHLPPDAAPARIVDHLHGQLAQSGAALVAVQLDDAFGCLEAQNLPGTIAEHPNWRRRLPVAVTALDRAAGMTRKT